MSLPDFRSKLDMVTPAPVLSKTSEGENSHTQKNWFDHLITMPTMLPTPPSGLNQKLKNGVNIHLSVKSLYTVYKGRFYTSNTTSPTSKVHGGRKCLEGTSKSFSNTL